MGVTFSRLLKLFLEKAGSSDNSLRPMFKPLPMVSSHSLSRVRIVNLGEFTGTDRDPLNSVRRGRGRQRPS